MKLLLARFHRRRCNIEACPYYLTIANKDTIRLRLLAAYLRLADALHIDQSRTPDNQYAISLAYNIPYKSKLHWYRSKFVHGVRVDTEEKVIIIQLKRPIRRTGDRSEEKRYKKIEEKYNFIYDVIINDLNEEIESVKNVLFLEGITYFLSAEKDIIPVEVDDVFKKDVEPVLHCYHLLDNPSSSALVTLVLEAIESIASSENKNKCNEDSNGNLSENKNIKEEIERFLEGIDKNVLSSRKCHTALSNLINRLRKDVIESDNFKNGKNKPIITGWIEKEKREVERKKFLVRYNSAKYLNHPDLNNVRVIVKNRFEWNIKEVINRYNGSYKEIEGCDIKKINIILYGYSELSIETLCGFRDAVAAIAANEYRKKKQEEKVNDECRNREHNETEQKNNSYSDAIENIDLLFYQHETIEKFEKEASILLQNILLRRAAEKSYNMEWKISSS